MADILSHRDIECIIMGHRVEGWATDDPPIEFPSIDLMNVETGRDGTVYGTDTAMLGGEVKLKLLPTSRTALWFLIRLQERNKGVKRIFAGIYSNIALNYSVSMRGGLLKMMTPIIVQGQTFEPTIHFEELIPDVEAATFSPAPRTS